MNKVVAWSFQESEMYEAKLKRFQKKNLDVTLLIFNNLDTYFKTLSRGVLPQQITAKFVHHEPEGVRAIDQSGSRKKMGVGGKPKEGRLYVFPDLHTKTLYLITIGDKNSQTADLADCKAFMSELKKSGE